MEYLRTQTLILSVWHHDTFGKNSFLGEVDVELSKWDFDHTQMNYLALKARVRKKINTHKGFFICDIVFSSYNGGLSGECGPSAHLFSRVLFELVISDVT